MAEDKKSIEVNPEDQAKKIENEFGIGSEKKISDMPLARDNVNLCCCCCSAGTGATQMEDVEEIIL